MSAFINQVGEENLILLLFILIVILLLWNILNTKRNLTLSRKLDTFMRGKDAESLEDIMRRNSQDIAKCKADIKSHSYDISSLRRQTSRSCSRMGLIKYNGFVGMGGKASFALTLLDNTNSGIILNVIHSREGSYPYIKEVTNGVCETTMSEEEKNSLEMAMRNK